MVGSLGVRVRGRTGTRVSQPWPDPSRAAQRPRRQSKSDSLSPRYPATPPPVAVIGAGIVGAAIAHRLAEQGCATLLLDRSDSEAASNATASSFAMVTAREQTLRAFFDLSRAAMEDYRRLAWKLAPAPWYHVEGSLAWFGERAKAAALREQVQRLRDWGYAAEMLPASAVLEDLEPGLTFAAPGTPVAWFPDEAWVDPRALTRRLVEGVRNAGGRVLTGSAREVVAIGIEAGRVCLADTGGRSIDSHRRRRQRRRGRRRSRGGAGGTALAGAGAAQSCRTRTAAGWWQSPPPSGPNRRHRHPTRWTGSRLARSSW